MFFPVRFFFGVCFCSAICHFPTAISLNLKQKLLNVEETEYSNDAGDVKTQSQSGCGGIFVDLKEGSHGIIESPNYPNKYSPESTCEWRLQAEPGISIHAIMFDLRTNSDTFKDLSDSVYISLVGRWNETQKYGGDLTAVTPFPLISDGYKLLVKFKSSNIPGNGRGFRLGYYATRNKPAASQPADDVLAASCTYIPVSTPAIFPDKGVSIREHIKSIESLQRISRENPNPFLVGLLLNDNQFCSGTLISHKHVITSAHCVHQVEKIELVFGTADLHLEDAGVQRRIVNSSSVIIHPEFNPRTGVNDISIITMAQQVEFNRFVRPARLPSWNLITATLAGADVALSGWGEHDGNIISRATISKFQLSPLLACRSSLHKGLTGMMMCASPNNELCTMDSGSPVTTRCKPSSGSGGNPGPDKPVIDPTEIEDEETDGDDGLTDEEMVDENGPEDEEEAPEENENVGEFEEVEEAGSEYEEAAPEENENVGEFEEVEEAGSEYEEPAPEENENVGEFEEVEEAGSEYEEAAPEENENVGEFEEVEEAGSEYEEAAPEENENVGEFEEVEEAGSEYEEPAPEENENVGEFEEVEEAGSEYEEPAPEENENVGEFEEVEEAGSEYEEAAPEENENVGEFEEVEEAVSEYEEAAPEENDVVESGEEEKAGSEYEEAAPEESENMGKSGPRSTTEPIAYQAAESDDQNTEDLGKRADEYLHSPSSNIILGFVSFGNCKQGYALTRLTAHLDFIGRHIGSWYNNTESGRE